MRDGFLVCPLLRMMSPTSKDSHPACFWLLPLGEGRGGRDGEGEDRGIVADELRTVQFVNIICCLRNDFWNVFLYVTQPHIASDFCRKIIIMACFIPIRG